MDLSKAFDSINHNLLVAKLEAYSFSGISSQLMKSYLKNRKHRINVNSSFSEWETILTGVPQGSILGPLLFNVFLNDLLLFVTHFRLSNYADENTQYCFSNNISDVKDNIIDLAQVIEWFDVNYMILNADKYHTVCV